MQAGVGDSAFSRYADVIRSLLGEDAPTRLNPTDRLAALGWSDSVTLVQLVSQLEEAFDISMPPEALLLENFDTVDSLWLVLRVMLKIDI